MAYAPNLSYHLEHHWDNHNPYSQILDPQNVVTVAISQGALGTISNLFLSGTPITNLDVGGSTALQDIECYVCPNLQYVNVTDCPNLQRACFEKCSVRGVLDFSGTTNLLDVRGALNQFTDVNFGDAGSKVWHLCIRDNPQLNSLEHSLTNLHSLREWFVWNGNQQWPITPSTLPSTNLYDVEIYSNRFEHVDFSGQRNLVWLDAYYNNLTNALLTNCYGRSTCSTSTYHNVTLCGGSTWQATTSLPFNQTSGFMT